MNSGRKAARDGRRRWFPVAAVALGFLSAVVVAELALRVAGYDRTYVNPLHSFHVRDARLGYRGKPHFAARFVRPDFDVLVRHDERGFRRHEHQGYVAPDRPTVYVLGDSFTWGWGVDQGEVYTDRLAELLPDHHVQNLGLNASGTVQQFALFEELVEPQLRPGDVVLIAFFWNDFADNVEGFLQAEIRDGQLHLVEPRQLGAHAKDTLKDHSHLFNLLAYWSDYARQRRRAARARIAGLAPPPETERQSLIVRHAFSAFAQRCAQSGARLLVAYVPGQAELGEASDEHPQQLAAEQALHAAFTHCAREAGIETVELIEGLLESKQSAPGAVRLTFPGDEHWTPAGHAAAAQWLAEAIRDVERVENTARLGPPRHDDEPPR